jgi:hypothetical protein
LKKWVGHKAENKYVPSEAFIANENFIKGLLNGYYSGDGTISKNSIDVSSASKRLIEGIGMLCSRFGIFGKVFMSQLKTNNLGTKNIKPTHRFSIRAQYGKIFTEKVILLENNKNEKMKNIVWKDNFKLFKTYNDVLLDEITEINIIGVEKHPKVYDLTIPSTLNFGLANGLQVRETLDEMLAVLRTRTTELAALCGKEVKVSWNGETVAANTFEKFVKLFGRDQTTVVYEMCGPRWEVAAILTRSLYEEDVGADEGSRAVSFVNGINTKKGGKHVDTVVRHVLGDFCEAAAKKKAEEEAAK